MYLGDVIMKLKQITTAAAIVMLSSSLALAGQTYDEKAIYVQPANSYTSTYSRADQQLVNELISKLESDNKLSGQLEVAGRNGNISISGRVSDVTMIYRVVEIVKRNSGVKNVDVRQLDT
jgi:osmotically-inducible protein OsmY